MTFVAQWFIEINVIGHSEGRRSLIGCSNVAVSDYCAVTVMYPPLHTNAN